MNIIHPPSQLRRDVDKKTTGGSLRRRVHSGHRTSTMPPLRISESNEDLTATAGCRAPELLFWKRDFDQFFGTTKPAKNTTTFVEWKKAPKKRKKKKNGDSNTSLESESLLSRDELSLVSSRTSSRRGSRGDRKYDPNHSSRKENSRRENMSPPQQFKPAFSHSRYSNLQKFKALSSYYREQRENSVPTPRSYGKKDPESMNDLAAIKKELADLKRWATTKNDNNKGKKVQFAHPLISQLKYRPKTQPEDIDSLFFREDELMDWEEDRETTSPEFVELVITDDDEGPMGLQVCEVA